jgi:hypothetical protein
MRGLVVRIEDADGVPAQRLQGANPRELDWAGMFGCVRQHLSRRQHHRHAVVGFGDDLAEMDDSVSQRRQLDAILEYDRLGKTQGPGHDGTRNRTGI